MSGGEPLCFVVRKRDGQFLRGARWWRWTRNWRRAALLTPSFVQDFCVGKYFASIDEVELLTTHLPAESK